MSPEEKIEAAQKLIDEARAEIAAKKRNWPETIEAGMVFYHNRGGFHYMACSTDGENVNNLVCLKAGQNYSFKNLFHGDEADFSYLGHARDLIKIADDAHEPTGAELVGKYCEYCDIDGDWDNWGKGECKDFIPGTDQPYLRNQGGRFRFARLSQ